MVKIDSQRISFNDLGIEKRAKEAGLLIPIGDVPAYNASDYKNVAVDVGGADNAEALVDVKEYGIASVPYYLEQAKNNPTYKRNITGAPEINFVREGTAKKIQEANNILFADFKEQYFEREHCALAQQNEENAASLTLKRKINDEKARAFALDFCSCADNFDEKDPKTWTIHSTGGAVDVYLLDKKTNRVVDNGDNYFDNPKEITHTNYYEKKDAGKLTEEQNGFLSARRVLYNVMNTVGFVNFGYENFHYSYQDQYWGRVKNVPAKYGYQKSPRDRGLSNIMSALLSKAVERK